MNAIGKPDPNNPAPDAVYALLDRAGQIYEQELLQSHEAMQYLRDRGIDDERIRRYRIGYAPSGNVLLKALGDNVESRKLMEMLDLARRYAGRLISNDRFHNRIMFPIRDLRGRIQGFGGRVFGADESAPGKKYLNSSDQLAFRKGQTVYGLYERSQAAVDSSEIVVVEGYMDVIGLDQHGFPGAVAPLGTAITPAQFDWLFSQGMSAITLCFDGDSAGRAAAWRGFVRLLPDLIGAREIRFALLPDGQDPEDYIGQYGVDAFRDRVLGRCLSAGQFVVQQCADGLPLDSVESKGMLADRVRQHYWNVPSGSACGQDILKHLGVRIGLDPKQLETHFKRNAPWKPQGRAGGQTAFQARSRASFLLQLLAHKPRVAESVAEWPDLSGLGDPGVEWLQRLYARARMQPDIPANALLAEFAGQADGRVLAKLLHRDNSGRPHPRFSVLTDEQLGREFADGMEMLERQAAHIRKVNERMSGFISRVEAAEAVGDSAAPAGAF